jgi:hypothetical protein
MKGNPVTGITIGNGAALNFSIGFIPAKVEVWNVTDGDIVTYGFCDPYTMTFTSGGTTQITKGMAIKGATSLATARVTGVMLSSGTWAGGDAAGILVLESIVGTFTTESVYITSDQTTGADDASGVLPVTHSMKIDTAAATVTTTSAITPYVGDTTHFRWGSPSARSSPKRRRSCGGTPGAPTRTSTATTRSG